MPPKKTTALCGCPVSFFFEIRRKKTEVAQRWATCFPPTKDLSSIVILSLGSRLALLCSAWWAKSRCSFCIFAQKTDMTEHLLYVTHSSSLNLLMEEIFIKWSSGWGAKKRENQKTLYSLERMRQGEGDVLPLQGQRLQTQLSSDRVTRLLKNFLPAMLCRRGK